MWKYIPPPWTDKKPRTLRQPPVGAANVEGRTPADTIQMIGLPGGKVPRAASIDLGFVDVFISDYGRKIRFAGGGMDTDVGAGVPGPTRGMSINTGYQPPKVKYGVRRKATKKSGRHTGWTSASLGQITGL